MEEAVAYWIYYSGICLVVVGKLGRDSNRKPPEHEFGTLGLCHPAEFPTQQKKIQENALWRY
jgi:hypothetical protein